MRRSRRSRWADLGDHDGRNTQLSDEDEKKDIRGAAADTRAAIAALRPYTFEYDDPSNGPGERVGVMAQDMAKTRAGRGVVMDGKPMRLDIGNAIGLALAGLSDMERRLKAIESGKAALRAA
jgi:hypothetical protein